MRRNENEHILATLSDPVSTEQTKPLIETGVEDTKHAQSDEFYKELATSPGEHIDLTTSPPNNQPGVLNRKQKILGGKKGKGPALMSVLAKPENWTRKLENVGNITPKRKKEKVF